MASDRPKESVRFADSVTPDSSQSKSYQLPNDGTIESLDVRIYRGAELDLHVTPKVRSVDGQHETEAVVFQGKSFIDGDGDHWQFPISEPVEENEELVVDAVNEDPTYAYDYAVDFTVDYEGGTSRLSGLLDLFRGIL